MIREMWSIDVSAPGCNMSIHSKNVLEQWASSSIAATHQHLEYSQDDKIVDIGSLPGLCSVCDQASIQN